VVCAFSCADFDYADFQFNVKSKPSTGNKLAGENITFSLLNSSFECRVLRAALIYHPFSLLFLSTNHSALVLRK
jgi:hypothetical protein